MNVSYGMTMLCCSRRRIVDVLRCKVTQAQTLSWELSSPVHYSHETFARRHYCDRMARTTSAFSPSITSIRCNFNTPLNLNSQSVSVVPVRYKSRIKKSKRKKLTDEEVLLWMNISLICFFEN